MNDFKYNKDVDFDVEIYEKYRKSDIIYLDEKLQTGGAKWKR
jgi:hypothetical protein